jgi:phage/plasmid-like protein (TIGR03299 family)
MLEDGTFEMAYYLPDGLPWHGLGQPITAEQLIDCNPEQTTQVWGQASNMTGWDILTTPVLYYDEDNNEVLAAPDKKVAFRSDTRCPLEVVGRDYKVVQPREVLQFFEDVIGGLGYHMTSAGVMFGGKKFWAQAMSDNTRSIQGVDKVNSSILLATGFDGATVGMHTTTRVVCNNTLRMAMGNNANKVRTAHSSVFDSRHMKEQLGLDMKSTFQEWCDMAEAMSTKAMTEYSALQYWGNVFGIYGAEESKLTAIEKVEMAAQNKTISLVNDLWAGEGKGSLLTTSYHTLWGALNAVTEYIDHKRATQTIDSRINGAWFGSQANIKQRAWDEALLLAA